MDALPITCDLPDELVGARVRVRPYQPGDGMAVWEAIDEGREHLRRWLPFVDQHATPQDSEAFVRRAHARWVLREELIVGVWERASGRYLGSSGLHVRNVRVPFFEIGYWLRETELGRGYMTESVDLLVGLAFGVLGARRLEIRCDAENERSLRLPVRLGFVREGERRHDCRDAAGALRTTVIFARTEIDPVG